MIKTHQRATHQASIGEFIEGSDVGDDETAEPTITTGVDPETTIYLGPTRYHQDRHGVPGCPSHRDLTKGTIREAAQQNLQPCRKCHPVDWREEENAPQEEEATAVETLEGWR